MELIKGLFLERLNRFVVRVEIKGRQDLAYLPNPGRLWELLLPKRPLLLTKNQGANYPYTVIACLHKDYPVLLHTHLTNHYIANLIENKEIPLFKDYVPLKREPKVPSGRLDLLLENRTNGEKLYLEIKTCTLFGEKLALFPDAETKRGTRHLYELLRLTNEGYQAGCLFVVMSPEVKYFLPAYHIDFEFTEAFLTTYEKVLIEAISVRFSSDLKRINEIKSLSIPIEFLRQEFKNGGAYLLIISLEEDTLLKVGELGEIFFKAGFYVYVGSGRKNLKERVKRHLQKRKKKRWHIDYLLEKAHIFKTILIVSSEDLECDLAKDLMRISQVYHLHFGSSDCKCPSHLFYFSENPLIREDFLKIVNHYRLENPAQKIEDLAFSPLKCG
jgi:sugar fermentation stimulation protein A